MANHTITVINKSGGVGNGGRSGLPSNGGSSPSSIIFKTLNKTSFQEQIEKKSFNGKGIINGIRIGRTLNVGSAIGMFGSGASTAVATAQEISKTVEKGVGIYTSVMEAKTGNSMVYSNTRNRVSMILHPMSYGIKKIWDYGVLERLRVARENESLNFSRELTGNLIFSKNYNNGVF
jgi:hypothetical protein